jgi:putative spermidine/putrescine transport system substrate-binding protein
MKKRLLASTAVLAVAAFALTACAGTAGTGTSASGSITKADAAKATSATDFGGIDGLVAAANAEGQLNVITLPPSWANYGKIIAGFEKKYPKITINSANPDGSSADEVSAAKAQKGQDTAPDVFDIGTTVLQANLDLVTPYKVKNWADIPDTFKEAKGAWYYDYTGLMSVGYDSKVIKTAPKSIDDLLGSAYQGKVAIKGDPTQANEAAQAVTLAAFQSRGSGDDIQPGIDFFAKLKKAGNFLAVTPTQATVASGETPVVIQWNFNNLSWGAAGGASGNPDFETVVLPGTGVASYYNQAINADAPHPAAARLWEEWIYSPEVQNLYLASSSYPATLDAMIANKTVDQSVLTKVGKPDKIVQLTVDQNTKAGTLLSSKWAAAIG